MSELKTHADIIAQMRKIRYSDEVTGDFAHYAYELDAAHKREVDALKQRCAELDAEVAAKDEVIQRLNDALAEEQRRRMSTTEKSSVVDTKFELCNHPEQVLKIGRDFQNKDGYRGAHYDTVKLLCDTIEYQQEQLETKTEVGDVAKLREAIEAVLLAFNYGESTIVNQLPFSKLLPMLRKCVEALAAPPRNCDRFGGDIDKLREACLRERGLNPDEDFPEIFCEWLLAPSTAKEGGAK